MQNKNKIIIGAVVVALFTIICAVIVGVIALVASKKDGTSGKEDDTDNVNESAELTDAEYEKELFKHYPFGYTVDGVYHSTSMGYKVKVDEGYNVGVSDVAVLNVQDGEVSLCNYKNKTHALVVINYTKPKYNDYTIDRVFELVKKDTPHAETQRSPEISRADKIDSLGRSYTEIIQENKVDLGNNAVEGAPSKFSTHKAIHHIYKHENGYTTLTKYWLTTDVDKEYALFDQALESLEFPTKWFESDYEHTNFSKSDIESAFSLYPQCMYERVVAVSDASKISKENINSTATLAEITKGNVIDLSNIADQVANDYIKIKKIEVSSKVNYSSSNTNCSQSDNVVVMYQMFSKSGQDKVHLEIEGKLKADLVKIYDIQVQINGDLLSNKDYQIINYDPADGYFEIKTAVNAVKPEEVEDIVVQITTTEEKTYATCKFNVINPKVESFSGIK